MGSFTLTEKELDIIYDALFECLPTPTDLYGSPVFNIAEAASFHTINDVIVKLQSQDLRYMAEEGTKQ